MSKLLTHFSPKNCVFYLPPFQSTYFDIIKSILYSESWDTMNYAKKVVNFVTIAYFFMRNT